MSKSAHPDTQRTFRLDGSVSLFVPVAALVKGVDVAHVPTRRLAGWLTTYGKLRPDGSIEPTEDRDGQVMEASAALSGIDWSDYVKGGMWNDGHRALLPNGKWPAQAKGPPGVEVFVGVPTSLDFHDGSTPLSQAHGKVGFFTSGHLFDRDDPSSWELYTDYKPKPEDLDRADHFWKTANVLDGTGASLGLSAHGLASFSKCRRRILTAVITQAAVLSGPRNPDSTLDLVKGVDDDVLAEREGDPATVFGRARPAAGVSPCGACNCGPNACARELAKGAEDRADAVNSIASGYLSGFSSTDQGQTISTDDDSVMVPQDLEGAASGPVTKSDVATARDQLVIRIMALFKCDAATAGRWIDDYQPEASP